MSPIFASFLSTPQVMETFSEGNFLDAMLRFEASLAGAQASLGLIPQAAAQSIVGTCKVELFDVTRIVREGARAGCIADVLVKSLKETVGLFNKEAAPYVHHGGTAQDLVDTALALLTRDALQLIAADVDQLIATLLALAQRHAADPQLSRSDLRSRSLSSFGLSCAAWAAPLARSQQRLRASARQALCVQWSGPAGTTGARKGKAAALRKLLADELGLNAPMLAGDRQRDEWVALGCELGLLVGGLGKMAKDMARMSQPEVGELHAPEDQPALACAVALAAAQQTPQRVATLLAALTQDHEGALGQGQAELAQWPGLLMAAHSATRALAGALPAVTVDTLRMRANLEAHAGQATGNSAAAERLALVAHAEITALLEAGGLPRGEGPAPTAATAPLVERGSLSGPS